MITRWIVLTLLFAGTGIAQAAPQWRSLFNGRDLTGWTQRNGQAVYAVAEGRTCRNDGWQVHRTVSSAQRSRSAISSSNVISGSTGD